jgi:hypothetical protein
MGMGNLLFRRRQIWLPTLWGWLALLIIVGVTTFFLLMNANRFLSETRPAHGADGTGARTLVVEGWLDQAALDQAVAAFAHGRYERVLTTGGPILEFEDAGGWKSFATRAAQYLRTNGAVKVPVIALPAPNSAQERTYLSAVMVRDWAQRSGIELGAIDVFTADVHARRSRIVYRMAMGHTVEVGIIAARATEYDDVRWWASSAGAKSTMGELLSVAWTTCCFWPDAGGLNEGRAATPASGPQ